MGIILLVLVAGLGTSDTTGGGTQTGTTADGGGDESAGIGDPVSDGQFTFVVQDFECGLKKIGQGILAAEAQGQFCVAAIAVENTGDQAAQLNASSQYAYIDDKQYEASSEVVTATEAAKAFFLETSIPAIALRGSSPGTYPRVSSLIDWNFTTRRSLLGSR